MKIALIYGYFSSQARGPYDVLEIKKHDLTGSESFFFNMATELAKLHQVVAFGFWKEDVSVGDNLQYKKFEVTDTNGELKTLLVYSDLKQFDVAVAWNEPDYLVPFPDSTKTICVQQLNDFSYCRAGFQDHTDLFLFPSEVHREHMLRTDSRLKAEKCKVLSNCINSKERIDSLNGAVYPANKRMVYCSSPDRGLHWIADMFQDIRKDVPDATLDVYYRYQSWYDNFKDACDPNQKLYYELGVRARFIQEFFERFGTDGSNGVTLHGQVPSAVVAEALVSGRMLFYPCDTVLFTEGFGVSVLDACYAGAVPVISDCDAFGSIYTGAAEVIPGRVRDNKAEWVKRVIRVLTDNEYHFNAAKRARAFAEGFTPELVCERLLGHINSLKAAEPDARTIGTIQTYKVNGWDTARWLVDDLILVGGMINDAEDARQLREQLGVKAVINVAAELSDKNFGFEHLLENGMPDDGSPRKMDWYHQPLSFAKEHIKAGNRVYVHCAAGLSRSPAVAYALLRGVLGLSQQEALARIRVTRDWYGTRPENQVYLYGAETALSEWNG